MRKAAALFFVAALVAAPSLMAPDVASASCVGRKNTGTVIGGIGGALVGNAVANNTTGTIVGGLGGAVIGHQVAKGGCSERRVVYRNAPRRTANTYAPAQRQPAVRVYYDQYGNPVGQAPAVRR